jgi:hypothetical protein
MPSAIWALSALLARAEPCDTSAVWEEFETTLRGTYAYLDRPWLEPHLERMGEQVSAAPDFESARELLHRGSLAFADPHVLVGPLSDTDPNVWPTSADLVLAMQDGHATITDVRQGSAAAAAGLLPGDVVLAVDGQPLDPRRVYLDLVPDPTPEQVDWAVTLLANGHRGGDRTLRVRRGRKERTVELESPRVLAREVSKRSVLTVSSTDGVCVLRPENALGNLDLVAAVDSALASCDPARGLVLDLRNTPSGGNTDVARGIMGHFTQTTQSYQIH